MRLHPWMRLVLVFGLAALAAPPALAQKPPTSGVTDSEIKIGQTMPYSGAASAYGAIGKAEAAYIAMINEQGGVNGRKINLVSLDDGYSPPKTFEQTRRLVEQEKVAFIFSSLGTPTGVVVHKYLNEKKVPQIFQASGATLWGDPQHFPWSIGWQPNYQTEGAIYGRYLRKEKPDARVAILYQNDDAGRDYVAGFKAGGLHAYLLAGTIFREFALACRLRLITRHPEWKRVCTERKSPAWRAYQI